MSLTLTGQLRTKTGKTASRAVRNASALPAVLYGLKDNISLQVQPKELTKLIAENGRNALIDLHIEGDTVPQRKVILKEYQAHPLRELWTHADFQEVDMARKIRVDVPIIYVGHSPGEKLGGIVNHILFKIALECLPSDIPRSVEINMGQIELGQVLHVADLNLGANVTLLHRPDEAVVSVYEEKVKEAKPAAAEAGAEGEAAPAAEAAGAKTE